jgi:hypothetical protein
MQFNPNWEKERANMRVSLEPLIEPLFLCYCLGFLRRLIATVEKDDLTPEFANKVFGIFELLLPMAKRLLVSIPEEETLTRLQKILAEMDIELDDTFEALARERG